MRRFAELRQSATVRLTFWYLLIIVVLSVCFSIIVYGIAAHELHRPIKPAPGSSLITNNIDPSYFERIRQQREDEGRSSLLGNLFVFNLAVITTGGLASYLLARRTLEPIEEALDAQTRFSSDAAHELRTPLAVMQSEIEIGLRVKNPSVKKQQALLASNLDEVNRLRSLTDRLLILSSDKAVALNPTSLDDVATEALNRVINLAQTKHISIETTVGKEKAIASSALLTDTVVILLDNAIKYCSENSQVTIRSQEQGRHVLLQVEDNGPGIAPVDLPHIFDRFYRADQSRSKANVAGHGLGLSIAKRSIEAMGGSISCQSAAGHGTIFSIHLDAA